MNKHKIKSRKTEQKRDESRERERETQREKKRKNNKVLRVRACFVVAVIVYDICVCYTYRWCADLCRCVQLVVYTRVSVCKCSTSHTHIRCIQSGVICFIEREKKIIYHTQNYNNNKTVVSVRIIVVCAFIYVTSESLHYVCARERANERQRVSGSLKQLVV